MHARLTFAMVLTTAFAAVACDGSSPTIPTAPTTQVPPVVIVVPPQVMSSTLTGLLYEPGAGPLDGVAVAVRSGATTTTDASGRFAVAVNEGAVVSFSRSGLVSRYRQFAGLSGAPVNIGTFTPARLAARCPRIGNDTAVS